MDQNVIDLYDEYTHAPLNRRVFLERLTALAGGTAVAGTVLGLLENDYARAEVVSPDDVDISAERMEFEGESGPISAYLAKPAGAAKSPAAIVIHENRGLNPHIEDVARRAAVAGFLALAPDLLSPLGGTPSDEDRARELIGRLDAAEALDNLKAARAWLADHSASTGKVGAVGFCWGGGMVNQLAVADPDLNAGVVFYGRSPDSEQVTSIRAPLLLNYAGLDSRINASVPEYEAALREAGKQFTLHMYDDVQHAFHNDTNAARYDEAAAALAWRRTVEFLREKLG